MDTDGGAAGGCEPSVLPAVGIATSQIGGEIKNAKEDIPGEPRGYGVSGEHSYPIGPGDVVVIPRNTTHHMEPGAEKLGYVLIKVWVD